MDVIIKSYVDRMVKGIASGFDHAESTTNADGTVTMTMNFKKRNERAADISETYRRQRWRRW